MARFVWKFLGYDVAYENGAINTKVVVNFSPHFSPHLGHTSFFVLKKKKLIFQRCIINAINQILY